MFCDLTDSSTVLGTRFRDDSDPVPSCQNGLHDLAGTDSGPRHMDLPLVVNPEDYFGVGRTHPQEL